MIQLVGLPLGEARKLAESNGYIIENIKITAPPKLDISEFDDTFRVLRVNASEKKLYFIVCKPL